MSTPKQESVVKKGNTSWRPPKRMNLKGKKPGFTYRWVTDDPLRVAWMEEAGWSPATFVQGDGTQRAEAEVKSLTGSKHYRGMIPMMIPTAEYRKHRAYYEQQTLAQTMSLKQRANAEIKKQAGPKAQVDGTIIIN